MKEKIVLRSLLFLSIILIFSLSTSLGQSGISSVTGTVSDIQGNIVPGATVTLIGEQNNRRTTVANENGAYTFASVQPGNYSIEVEAKGFKKSSVSLFKVLVDKTNDVSIKLEAGEVSETVTIVSGGIENLVNNQDASIGNNFVSRQIEQLPLNGRNVGTLLSLQAAVTPDGSVAGGRSDQANFTLDGIDVNDQQTGLDLTQTGAFTPVLRVTPDSVDEFRVTTSNPDASKGRSSGAQISFITKSGTNDFHGALYEYTRNTVTSANDFFNNLSGVARPKLIRNLFGGRLGGPIVKDRFFFFYNYEGLREAKETSVVQTVPLPSLGQGIIKFYDNQGNLIALNTSQINALTSDGNPVVDVNPLVLGVLAPAAARYPANDTTTGDGLNTGGFRFNASQPVKLNTHTVRFDWAVTGNQKHQLSFRANYQQDIFGGTSAFPDTSATNTWSHPIGLAVSYTWLISNNKTNRFSYGLTRVGFSNQGDANQNNISFRDIFSPLNFTYGFSRVNPTHNFTDDFTWVKGNHNLQIGTNIRLIRNKRVNFGASFDNALTNFGAYEGSGAVLLTPLDQYLQMTTGDPDRAVDSGSTRSAQNALTAVLGRLSQYSASFNFNLQGNPIAAGSPVIRDFATEEYDFYVQDSWKFKPNLTLTLGLRYGLSRPVYETQGYQAITNIPLEEYFKRRVEAAAQGNNYTDPLTVVLAGPKNKGKDFYNWDKNNFQPRLAAAWSPNFKKGWLATFFGKNQESVLRGGFAVTNDYFGQQLAVDFDANNSLGFSSLQTIAAETYNITDKPAPLYTGSGMSVRNLSGITVPANLAFPQQFPLDDQRRIESSLDSNLVSPVNYSWDISYGRKLPFKMYLDVSYIGRAARHLLLTRDIMQPNNLTDPKSGQNYYQAATALELQLRSGATRGQIQAQPFFENLYPTGSLDFFGNGGSNTQAVFDLFDGGFVGANDWTNLQNVLDANSGKILYYQRQYAALSAFGTRGSSDYHAATLSIRQRLSGLTWDLNYTFSKSIDDASGLQTGGQFGTGFILNSLRQQDSRAVSDFDLRHIVNFNSVWDIPIGRDRHYFKEINKVVNGFLGGWQLSSIFRYNTGYPLGRNVFFDDSGWVTNWQIKSGVVPTKGITVGNYAGTGTGGVPNLFADPQAAYQSFRSPLPGEGGPRNTLRLPSYITLDAGLAKSFNFGRDGNQKITFRWDVFNVTNTAKFTYVAGTEFGLGYQPDKSNAPTGFGNFNAEQGTPRVMQFALRYDF